MVARPPYSDWDRLCNFHRTVGEGEAGPPKEIPGPVQSIVIGT